MRCASWLLMQEPIVTGCSQNVCWMYVGSRDRRVHRWSKNRGMIKLINKPTTCNYTTPPLCGIHFTTNVCNISGAMSITCIVSNCGWPLKVRIRAQWVVSECNTCSCPRVQAGLGKKMTKRIKKKAALNTICNQLRKTRFKRLQNNKLSWFSLLEPTKKNHQVWFRYCCC